LLAISILWTIVYEIIKLEKEAVSNSTYPRVYPVTVHMGESKQMPSAIVYEIHVHI